MDSRRNAVSKWKDVISAINIPTRASVAPTPQSPSRSSRGRIFSHGRNEHHGIPSMSESARKVSKISVRRIKQIILIGIIIFLIISIILMGDQHFAINNPEGGQLLNGVYFWATTTSTIGYGDICPKSPVAKALTLCYQAFIAAVSMGGIYYIANLEVNIKDKFKQMNKKISKTIGKQPVPNDEALP